VDQTVLVQTVSVVVAAVAVAVVDVTVDITVDCVDPTRETARGSDGEE
jgi:hypothetical protein